jgi:regulator of cell morphogenesis and NO signaling
MSSDEELSLEDLVTRIRVTHHVTTRTLLRAMHDKLVVLAGDCATSDLRRVGALWRTFTYFRDDLLAHLVGEERVVFPYVAGLAQAVEGRGPRPRAAFRSVASPVRLMRNEQEMAEKATQRLEVAILAARPQGPSPAWDALQADFEALRADLAVHVHLEQNVLFPRAIQAEETLLERRLRSAAEAGGRR